MKTIIYNILTGDILHHKPEGFYKVDGKRPELPEKFAELVLIEKTPPPFDPKNETLEFLGMVPDFENGEIYKSWKVSPLSEKEKALRAWKYPEYSLRLDIDKTVLFGPIGAPYFAFLTLNGFPIEPTESGYSVWLNRIEPEHAKTVEDLINAGLLTQTNRPE